MAAPATAYLVVRREDGFGDVYPLIAGQVPSGDVHHSGVVVHGDEAGIGRHPGEQP